MLDPAVLLNGCLHWVTYLGNQSERHVTILSFNVAKEEINVIELSHLSKEERFFDLLVLGERLCVVVDHASYCDIAIWVMKEYGVHSSWAKEYVFILEFAVLFGRGIMRGYKL
ncbi:hypothetical protein IFM89_014415 [Coptis chinensis]|uniref:F-box associated beta-propeller type 1 domain-containing protein n=1 Tax=Coptis chinensis TaxID=261450 RepID=A0A835M3C9_9MAGN|nr:hypothetical protein IFM89_014415 [Coptis chinensis]